MGTPFSTLRKFIRAAMLDLDRDAPLFSDEALDDQILLTNLSLHESSHYDVVTATSPSLYVNTLSSQQILTVSITTAIRILSAIPENYSYKTPVISGSRRGGTYSLIAKLQELLSDAEGGIFAIATDTDFDALAQGFVRFYNGVTQSQVAWSGVPTATE